MAVFEISKYKIFKPKQLQTFIFVVWYTPWLHFSYF